MLVLAALAAAMLSTVAARETFAQASRTKSEVMKAEREYVAALLKSDAAAFSRLFASNYVVTKNTGQTMSKAEHIAYVKSGASKFRRAEITDVTVTLAGNAAVVTGQLSSDQTDETGAHSATSRYTHVWVKQNGRWRMVSNHFHRPDPNEK
jgi:ketosteroid isomerase-like protein